MKNNIRNKVYSMVDDHVFNQAWDVWKQVSDQVCDHVSRFSGQVRDQVLIQVRGKK